MTIGKSNFGGAAYWAAALFGLLSVGCAHLGSHRFSGPEPANAPNVREVLSALAANDQDIRNFRAADTISMTSPDLAATLEFRGMLAVRRPAELCIEGRNPLGGMVFRLTGKGGKFRTVTATSEQVDTKQFERALSHVRPQDLVKELFFPEDWASLDVRRVHVISVTEKEGRRHVTLAVGARRCPRRLIAVEGPPWVVTGNERFDWRGRPFVIVTRSYAGGLDDGRLPNRIDAEFPRRQGRLVIELRNIRVNTDDADAVFESRPKKETVHGPSNSSSRSSPSFPRRRESSLE